ncbi:MAG: hypothetical protein WB996_00445 [Ignavibacteriaceae bacterium]
MKLLISDTNIFIDLIELDLLDLFLSLEYEIKTTGFVINELDVKKQRKIKEAAGNNKLEILNTDFKGLEKINSLSEKHRSLSLTDCSVLFFSQILKGSVITGDGALRKIAQAKGLEVSGILWVFDEFEKTGTMGVKMLGQKFKKLTEINKRLPKSECETRLRKWGR